ncbi:hypothetical protein [Arachidicoccus terrestris]|uniref:hypothetical protein n=1 Tax=Arachidicoccus terrestris TaxID=2875539 RepID=UPI001CC5DA22|nr:hypothetical protein [Arachidicoccus terrestris]UAY55425.1 hypothetical protein K9M52_18795 [Arachidicoccus terrestris]
MSTAPKYPMEELMDFISELHAQDRQKQEYAKAYKKAYKKAFAKSRDEAIRKFIQNRPKWFKVTPSSIAALFGISEKQAQSILSV